MNKKEPPRRRADIILQNSANLLGIKLPPDRDIHGIRTKKMWHYAGAVEKYQSAVACCSIR